MNGMNWSPAQDALLMELMADDRSFGQIARVMRLSRNAVMGRFNRLRVAMGWQAA